MVSKRLGHFLRVFISTLLSPVQLVVTAPSFPAMVSLITVLFIPEQSVVSCSTSEMISGQAVLTMVLVQVEDRPSAPVTVKA